MVNYFRCNEEHEQSQVLAKDQQFKEAGTANQRGGRAGSVDWRLLTIWMYWAGMESLETRSNRIRIETWDKQRHFPVNCPPKARGESDHCRQRYSPDNGALVWRSSVPRCEPSHRTRVSKEIKRLWEWQV